MCGSNSKYQLYVMLLCTVCFVTTNLQVFSQRFNGGIVLGMDAAHLTGSFVDSTSNSVGTRFFSKPGLNAGIFTNIYFDDNNVLDFEISYIQKGSRKIPGPNDTVPGKVWKTSTTMHYIILPIHYRYNFSQRISAFTGPNIGVLLGYKFMQNEIDFTDDIPPFSKFDFSWDFGVGIQLLYNISLDIKYSSTIFLLPVRSYNNDGFKFGPFAKQFWVKGQYNQLIDFTFRWTIFRSRKD